MNLTPVNISFFLRCSDESDAQFKQIATFVNVEICKWRGWKYKKHKVNLGDIADSVGWELGWVPPKGVVPNPKEILPSHIIGPKALGNMHETEKALESIAPTLGIPCRSLYLKELSKITGDYCWEMTHATARQRAIALLRLVKPELELQDYKTK